MLLLCRRVSVAPSVAARVDIYFGPFIFRNHIPFKIFIHLNFKKKYVLVRGKQILVDLMCQEQESVL